jgi:hypothetical protein
MENTTTQDLVKAYTSNFIEPESTILQDLFDDDIIYLDSEKDIQMGQTKIVELLTIISLEDNPNINLSVAQPSKYRLVKSKMGTGIIAYKLNALDILKRDLKSNEKIIKIHINVDDTKVLDLCTYRHKKYLVEVYKTANKKFKSEKSQFGLVCLKSKGRWFQWYNFIKGRQSLLWNGYSEQSQILTNHGVVNAYLRQTNKFNN